MDIFNRIQIRAIVFSILVLVAAVSISTETKAQVWSADVPPPVFVEQFTQVLWDQTGNIEGTAVTSQNFTDAGGAFDTFDNRAADDFEVPGATGWSINTVRAVGTYNFSPGPIQSLNVVFFRDSGGLPGSVIPGCNYQSILPTNNDNPDFIINLPEPCTLTSGPYWVSVQANMPFIPNGQWFWFTENVQTLNLYAWENPLNGTGNGCPTWTAGIICIPAGGPDLTFQLIGEPFATPRPIPTLSQWGLIATAGVMGILGVLFVVRRSRRIAVQ